MTICVDYRRLSTETQSLRIGYLIWRLLLAEEDCCSSALWSKWNIGNIQETHGPCCLWDPGKNTYVHLSAVLNHLHLEEAPVLGSKCRT